MNEVVFTSLGQKVDECLDATTWYSTYVGCNASCVCFNFKMGKSLKFSSYFPNGNKPEFYELQLVSRY